MCKWIGIILLQGLIILSGCSIINGSNDDKQLEIVSFSWILESFEINNTTIEIPQNQIYTLKFLDEPVNSGFDLYNLKIRADCNECWSDFQIFDNGAITIDPLICTEVYCGDESLDGQFTFALQNAFRYETEDHWTLRIFYENGDDIHAMRFRRVEK